MRVETRLSWLIVSSIIAASLCCAQEHGSGLDDATALTEPSLQQKADAGDREAQNQLGIIAQDNHDYGGAFKWFQLAANQGLSGAQVGLGFLYDMGLGIEKDIDQSAHWYGLAAAQGNPHGEFGLAICYLHGEGVEQDQILARKWFSSALKHGDGGRSLNGIGLTYDDGSRRDYTEAFRWYMKAAEVGYGEAKYNLCRMAAQGLGTAADYPEAVKWCLKAAESGDEWGQFGMGRINEDGTGVPPDLAKAAEWYRKSAERETLLHNLVWEPCTRMAKAFDAISLRRTCG
jgi:uncharacterized protein